MADPFVEICGAKLNLADVGGGPNGVYTPPRLCNHAKSVHRISDGVTAWPGTCEECVRLGWQYSEHAYDGVMLLREMADGREPGAIAMEDSLQECLRGFFQQAKAEYDSP